MKKLTSKGTLVAAIAVAMLTVRPLVATADGEGEDVKVVQNFLTQNTVDFNQGDCNGFLPVPPNPTCALRVTLAGTSGPPSPPVANTLYMTTLTPFLNELVAMGRPDGSALYTDFTDYNVSITGHGMGTFTMLETQASIKGRRHDNQPELRRRWQPNRRPRGHDGVWYLYNNDLRPTWHRRVAPALSWRAS
jgi:hypothetical protein